jgi:hypothetical protein
MRYVHELFRVHHLSPSVFAPPYDELTTARLRGELGLDRDGTLRKPADRTGFRSRPAAHRTSTR